MYLKSCLLLVFTFACISGWETNFLSRIHLSMLNLLPRGKKGMPNNYWKQLKECDVELVFFFFFPYLFELIVVFTNHVLLFSEASKEQLFCCFFSLSHAILKPRVPSKVRFVAWIIAHGRTSTCDVQKCCWKLSFAACLIALSLLCLCGRDCLGGLMWPWIFQFHVRPYCMRGISSSFKRDRGAWCREDVLWW